MRIVIRQLGLALLGLACCGVASAANQAPTATLTSPAAGTIFYAPATIELTATAQDPDGTINKVEFLNGSTVIPSSADTTGPSYSFTWANVGPGTYTIKARATDNGSPQKTGDSAAVQITVVQITTTIVSPANDSIVSGKTVNVTGHFTGAATTSIIVTSSAGHSVVASISGDTYTAQRVELRPGANVIEVSVARRDGTGETTSINITAVEPPVVVVTGPQVCAQPAPATVTLTAEALSPQGQISSVQFLVDGVPVGTASTPPYSVSATLSTVKTYTITAIATDQYGSAPSVRPLYLSVQAPPPTATITSPASGASYRVGTAIPLAATASDATGTVSSVQFFRGGSVSIGNPITTPPYALEWTDAPLGVHSITAVATNNLGVQGTSSAMSITVTQNSAPFVAITAPVSGSSFNAPAHIAIQASATDDGAVAEVEFFAGVQSLGKKMAAPYSLTWSNAPVGSHTLTAVARDDEGASSTSTPIAITVDGVSAAITAPADGASYAAPASFTLAATAVTSSGTVTKVEVFDGTSLLQTFNTGSETVDVNLALSGVAAGVHSYTAKATDSAGRTSMSPSVAVIVTGPPTVSITLPDNGAAFTAPATINLAANATATSGSVSKVEFFNGAELIATALTPPYQGVWSNVAAGNYTLTAKVTGTNGGTTTSAPVSITVSASTIAVISPMNGASVQGDRVLVRGTIQGPSNSGVMVNKYVAALAANGAFAVEIPLAVGSNQIEAVMTTPHGQSAAQTISVTADGFQPSVSIAASPVYATAPVTTKVTVTNNGSSTVTTMVDGSTPGPTVPAGESALIEVTYSTPGSFPLLVTATDAQSNVISKEFVVVSVDQAQLEQMLRANWTGMLNALGLGQKATALSYLDPIAGARYGPVFDALLPQMSSIVSSFSTPVTARITADFAEFIVNRSIQGVDNAFFIYMLRNRDGVWRIGGM
jgi:hypothetical protein